MYFLLALVFALIVVSGWAAASKAKARALEARQEAERQRELEAQRKDYEHHPPQHLDYDYITWLEEQMRKQNGDPS